MFQYKGLLRIYYKMGNKPSSVQSDPTEIKVPERFEYVEERDVNGRHYAIFYAVDAKIDRTIITGFLPLVKVNSFSEFPQEIQDSLEAYYKGCIERLRKENTDTVRMINLDDRKLHRYRIHENTVYDRKDDNTMRSIIHHVVSKYIQQPYILDVGLNIFLVRNNQLTV